ncbi:hypothetical protein [Tenacibaculum sp. M341]|uniref:hypothetical protein n=1 Tax=Tenacibaculum sp. M341 TaxID=2530339 RepID=UPI00104A6C4A|nr:hypothetical protein [Tenacibaculum sp. M341]TCI93214.1 hypothetical protein EYW44_06250 [Tenacibaculum sp. M341]
MSIELDKIITLYRKFTNGQYVAYDQFNEFLNSFEDQDRLSRVLLRGVGVACGLQPTLEKDKSISVSVGNANTTDGDLIPFLKDIRYSHFINYDNFKALYPPFYNGDNQIKLYELVSKTELSKVSGAKSLSSLGNLEDKYLVFYLESYEKDIKPCRGVDCDNYGVEQIKNLKVLLTDQDGIEHLSKDDVVYFRKDASKFYDSLQEIVLDRPLLNEKTNTQTLINDLYSNIVNDKNLHERIEKNYRFITGFFEYEDVFKDLSLTKLIEELSGRSKEIGIQYVYAFLRELISTYNEIKELLPELKTLKFPDFKAFQKHIMLGSLNTENKTYRHQFYKSPVVDELATLDKVMLLLDRSRDQVKNVLSLNIDLGTIKVIPSSKVPNIGKKAIPFYYLNKQSGGLTVINALQTRVMIPNELNDNNNSIRHSWDFETTVNRDYQNILGYHASNTSLPRHVQKPIDFNLDQASFFRVEGHLGKNYEEAKKFLDDLRFEKQLDFDVVLISLEKLDPNQGDETKINYLDYLERHPDVAHHSGVYAGGTFVMMYESETNPKVFADFTIPYICCPTKYNYSLSAPVSEVCRGDEDFILVAEPLLGEVKAFINGNQIDVIEKIAGQNYFIPANIPDSITKEEISFTVNDKPVETKLSVLPDPNVNITTSIAYFQDDSNRFDVTFSGLDSKYTYEFDFYSDDLWKEVKPNEKGQYTHKYMVSSGELKVEVKVLVKDTVTGCVLLETILVESVPDIEIISVDYTEGGCCNGLEIDSFYYPEGERFCIDARNVNQVSVPFAIETINSRPFTKVKGRYKLYSNTDWIDFTVLDINNIRTPVIAGLGEFDLQISISEDGNVWTDWYTCPRFILDKCVVYS